MRSIEEIKNNSYLRNVEITEDGGNGEISIGGWRGSIIFSYGAGWEHVSVAPYAKRIIPEWDQMCRIKEIFWNDDESVIQIHPPKDMYVNNKTNCLHLWRCTYKEMVLPPSCLVGIRVGQKPAELITEIKEAYEMAGEVYPG